MDIALDWVRQYPTACILVLLLPLKQVIGVGWLANLFSAVIPKLLHKTNYNFFNFLSVIFIKKFCFSL